MPFALKSVDEDMYCTANLLLEVIVIKSNILRIGRCAKYFSRDEVQCMIKYVSTC